MNKKVKKLFKKELTEINNLYLIYSSEEYLLDKFEKRFKDKFIDEGIRDFNLSYIKEEEEIYNKIVNQGSTLPMMSDKRFIVVKAGNILKQNVGNFEVFEKFIKDIPKSTILLIFINKDITNNKRKKIIEKNGEIINLSPPRFQKLNKWIKDQIEMRGKTIGYRGVKLLEKMFSNNLQQLDSEIEKICTYIEDKERIEVSDIKRVITRDRRLMENEIFEFLDALSNRKKAKSVYFFQHMIENGEVPQIIFSMLSNRIRLMIQIKELKERGLNPEKIAVKIDKHPYPVKRIYNFVDKYTFSDLERLVDEFLMVDVKLKTGQDSLEQAILNALISI